jgi:pimeloyl-ACP methyl ester carboxylesterase
MKKLLYILAAIVLIPLVVLLVMQKKGVPVEELKAKYATSPSQFIDINGLLVHYRIQGEGEPVVLVHGTGAVLFTWDGWVDSLSKKYKVITMDIPAFGLTGPSADENYSMESYVKFIDDFTKAIGIDTTFVLGGNSLGGAIAWEYAYAHPEKVSKLLLVSPAGSPVQVYNLSRFSVFRLARIPVLSGLLTGTDTKIIVKNTLKDVYYNDDLISDETIQMYYDVSMREGNRAAFVKRIEAIEKDPQLDPSKVLIPTLIQWGENDKVLPIEQMQGFRTMPNAKFIVYPKVGHSAQEEIPAQSASDAMRFLEQSFSPALIPVP